MKRLVWIVKIAILLLALLLGGAFALENNQTVTVQLWGLPMPELSLGVWLLGFALVGMVLGFLVSFLGYLLLKRRLRSRERQLARQQRELSRLQAKPLQES